MTIPVLNKLFHKKYQNIHWDIVTSRKDLLINLPFTSRTRLWTQVCYFLYKKEEPLFYQQICRYYKDEYEKINPVNQIIFLPFCNIHISLDYYQDRFRIYFDEYPEQIKLRKEYKK